MLERGSSTLDLLTTDSELIFPSIRFQPKGLCQLLTRRSLSTAYKKVFVNFLQEGLCQLLTRRSLSTAYKKVFVNCLQEGLCQLLTRRSLSTSCKQLTKTSGSNHPASE